MRHTDTLFSMPAGTPPQKVLAAVKNFVREEFGAKHCYADRASDMYIRY
jgi:hypothetical protein